MVLEMSDYWNVSINGEYRRVIVKPVTDIHLNFEYDTIDDCIKTLKDIKKTYKNELCEDGVTWDGFIFGTRYESSQELYVYRIPTVLDLKLEKAEEGRKQQELIEKRRLEYEKLKAEFEGQDEVY